MTIKCTEVDTGRDLSRFVEFPHGLYADDPNYRAGLNFDRLAQLKPNHPWFKHAQWQGFLAWDGDRPVGRISAQVERLNDDLGRPDLGYFGFLEAEDDPAVFDALFNAAESWLLKQGRTRVAGPFNLGINQEVGLLLEGFETPPYVMMPHGRPYYLQHVERLGYQQAVDLLAYEIDPSFDAPRVMKSMVRRLKNRVVVRALDRKRLDEDIAAMCDVFNDAWSNNWGFVPFTEEEFRMVAKEMLLVIPADFIQIAEFDGRPAAFIVMLPNLNEATRDLGGKVLPFGWVKLLWRLKVKYPTSGRVPLMGVRKEYQQTMFGPGLAFAVMEEVRWKAAEKGFKRVEMSWILESNQGMRNIIETIGGKVNKRYRMFEKDLA